jgi:formylmethanofuran dehydrogenase subunit E
MKEKPTLEGLLQQTAALHRHLCPRQVLGVRMGMLAGERIGVDFPQSDKRVFVFMETDGCTCDGVAVASGARVGRRTMRMMDFGKVAATFVDTFTGAAIRIWPHPASRLRAVASAPDAPDRWHAQLVGYQRLPAEEILVAKAVELTVDLAAIISRNGLRTGCAVCGEEISNGREVVRHGQELCRACAGEAYCIPATANPVGEVLTLGQNALVAKAVAPA